MKEYIVKISKTARQDLKDIISYIRYNLAGDIVADKYKILFKQEISELRYLAGSMPILDKKLTGLENIRKINVKDYVIFYVVNEKESSAFIVRVGHTFMNWEKFLKDE